MSKRDQIMDAALKLFVQQGLQATPMSQVAREGKTGMGTIYNLFPSKEALVNAIYVRLKEEEAIFVFENFPESASVRERFEFCFGRLTRYFLENPLEFQFIDRFALSPVITETSREVGSRLFEPVIQMLAEGQSQRIIKEVPIRQLAYFAMTGCSSLIRLHLADPELELEAAIQAQLGLAWDAIKS
ncbi:MAG: TetR/AcrR family transcriptional regulator [Salibacteraceae bacterium]